MKLTIKILLALCNTLAAQQHSFKLCVPKNSGYDIHYISIKYNHPQDGPMNVGQHVFTIRQGKCTEIPFEDDEKNYDFYITRVEAKNLTNDKSVKFDVEEDSNSDITTGIKIQLNKSLGIHPHQTFILKVLPPRSCLQHELNCVCNTDRDACFKIIPQP